MASDLFLASELDDGEYDWGAVENGISIQEIAGRSGRDDVTGSGTAQRVFLLRGTYDPAAARAALVDGPVLINQYDGKNLENIAWQQADAPDAWEFTCSYSYTPQPGGYTVSIDTTGGSILQTNAYAQSRYAASGETAIDYGTAIDVQDGNPQGIERVIPALKINVKARIKSSLISTPIAYAKTIASLTGSMNNGTYLGFAAGELLFIGASGDIVGEDPTLVFSFLASANVSGLTIGTIAGITKLGHDYLWFDYRKAKDSGTNMPTTVPRAAYVGRIYGLASMSGLQIGS